MEQFSHDLTLALEETSRSGGVRSGRWGARRRTRSTGNLPCAPQPTEDSSSSPADGGNNFNNADGMNAILSDSDDRQELKLSLKARQSCSMFGNFESDSLNENFSPARPNTRRKRKFKRMAVEYETTTPSTPGNSTTNTTTAAAASAQLNSSICPIAGSAAVKKRVLKHTSQENFRANLFFCGKRKRSHRDRYFEQHSSSVPRQRDLFAPKNSYSEYRSRNRSFSTAVQQKSCERIMPLNNSIVSKIEKISQDTRNRMGGFRFGSFLEQPIIKTTEQPLMFSMHDAHHHQLSQPHLNTIANAAATANNITTTTIITSSDPQTSHKITHKSESFESTFGTAATEGLASVTTTINTTTNCTAPDDTTTATASQSLHGQTYPSAPSRFGGSTGEKSKDHGARKHSKGHGSRLVAPIQFDDPNQMDCGSGATFNGFLSSSSLSSSDSEGANETNDSDREGDDELTDWPGNEVMVNFTSKNDFKRAKPPRLSCGSSKSGSAILAAGLLKTDELAQDDDTLMSADEIFVPPQVPQPGVVGSPQFEPRLPPNTLRLALKYSPADAAAALAAAFTSKPIDIHTSLRPLRHQIESEMSGETSNNFLSSPSTHEVREIRAGCRRIRNERPGFTILTSVNEDLSKFLQDPRQETLTLPDTDEQEHEKLVHLAKLYSLSMHVENGSAILTKTSNTTQSVKIDRTSMPNRFLGDYKRRCYGGEDDPESSGMAS